MSVCGRVSTWLTRHVNYCMMNVLNRHGRTGLDCGIGLLAVRDLLAIQNSAAEGRQSRMCLARSPSSSRIANGLACAQSSSARVFSAIAQRKSTRETALIHSCSPSCPLRLLSLLHLQLQHHRLQRSFEIGSLVFTPLGQVPRLFSFYFFRSSCFRSGCFICSAGSGLHQPSNTSGPALIDAKLPLLSHCKTVCITLDQRRTSRILVSPGPNIENVGKVDRSVSGRSVGG